MIYQCIFTPGRFFAIIFLVCCFVVPSLGGKSPETNTSHGKLGALSASQKRGRRPGGIRSETSAAPLATSLGPPGSPQLRPRVVSLNVMVAGLSGLGKTTMCQSLMESWRKEKFSERSEIPKTTMHIDASRLFERYDEATNTILRVRIIDTPGFGNRINYWHSVKPIVSYIQTCRHRKFAEEMSPVTSVQDYVDHHSNNLGPSTDDTLVHVCLYLVSPGRFLEIDKHFLRSVRKEVAVVPIIAKADTLTDEEIARYRAELSRIFKREKLGCYDFDESPTRFAFYRGRRAGELLAVISRNGIYPWGNSSALNPDHSDLRLVRDLLLSEHTERFLELALRKYATYRSNRLSRRKIQDGLKYVALGSLVLLQMGHLTMGKALMAKVAGGIASISGKSKDDSKPDDGDGKEASSTLEPKETQQEIPLAASKKKRGRIFGLFGTPEYSKSLRKSSV